MNIAGPFGHMERSLGSETPFPMTRGESKEAARYFLLLLLLLLLLFNCQCLRLCFPFCAAVSEYRANINADFFFGKKLWKKI